MKKLLTFMLASVALLSTMLAQNPLNQPIDETGSKLYNGFRYRLGSKGLYVQNSDVKPINGRIVILTVGASTPAQIATEFDRLVGDNMIVDVVVGNVGGKDINDHLDLSNPVWSNIDNQLKASGYTREDVSVIWTMQDDLRDNQNDFPGNPQRQYAKNLELFEIFADKFPNLQLVELSGRLCGYSTQSGHTALQCYYTGWCYSWLVQDYRTEEITLPFRISDGCYFFADGDKVRSDGFYQKRSFFKNDGVHLLSSGISYYGNYLYQYFVTNHSWFI